MKPRSLFTAALMLALSACASDSSAPADTEPSEVFPSTLDEPALAWNLSTPRSYKVTVYPEDGSPVVSEFTLKASDGEVIAFGLTDGATCDACQPDPGPGGSPGGGGPGFRKGADGDLRFPFSAVRLGEKSTWPVRYLALPYLPDTAANAQYETTLPENPSTTKLTMALTEKTRIIATSDDLVTFETVISSQLLANEGMEYVLDTSFANNRDEAAQRLQALAGVEKHYGTCQTLWSRSGYIVKRACTLPTSLAGEEIANVVVEAQGVADELNQATF